MTTPESNREVVLRRDVPFPRELVWKAITDPAHMQQWWGPDGTRYPNHSVFTEVVAPSRLVFDHGDGQRVWFIATILLDETAAGTMVTLRHLFPSREARDEVVQKYGAVEGGKQHLAKMEAYIRGHLV